MPASDSTTESMSRHDINISFEGKQNDVDVWQTLRIALYQTQFHAIGMNFWAINYQSTVSMEKWLIPWNEQ